MNQRPAAIALLALFVLVGLIVIPLAYLLLFSLRQGTPWEPGAFNLQNYVAVYSNPATFTIFFNTAVVAAASTALSLAIAVAFAILTERTDMPYRNLAWALMLLPLAVPGLLFAISWTFLLSPKIGLINLWLRRLFGVFGSEWSEGPLNLYSLWGMIFLEGLRGVTTIFLMTVGAFRAMDPSLEEASSAAGASLWTTFLRVTLPVLTPALLAAATYSFMTNLESLEIPIVIGVPAGIHVFPTYIYFTTQRFSPPEYGLAATLSLLLVVTGIALVAWHRRASDQAIHFATITGKGYRTRLLALGKWRYLALALYLLFFLLTVGAPLLALVWRSLFRYHVEASVQALWRASLVNYRAVLNARDIAVVALNSLWLSFGTATVTMVLSLIASWVIVRGRFKGKTALDSVLFLPHALPGVVIGIAFIFVFVQPPFGYLNLYGTLPLMILALTVGCMPFGSRTMNGALVQLHPELEEAAQVAGSSWPTIVRRIVLPLLLPSFISGWIWIVSHALRTFSLPLMLASRDSNVLSLVMWRMWDDGNAGQSAALGVMLILILAVLTAAGRWTVTRVNRQ